jgi:nucleolar protein 58
MVKQPLCIQVNEKIVVTASVLFDCEAVEKNHYPGFQAISRHLRKISGIDSENWDVLKLASAFNIICSHEIGDSDEVSHFMQLGSQPHSCAFHTHFSPLM